MMSWWKELVLQRRVDRKNNKEQTFFSIKLDQVILIEIEKVYDEIRTLIVQSF